MKDPTFIVDYAIELISTKSGSIPVWLRSGGGRIEDIIIELQKRVNSMKFNSNIFYLKSLYRKYSWFKFVKKRKTL
jgi:hypothetical protein